MNDLDRQEREQLFGPYTQLAQALEKVGGCRIHWPFDPASLPAMPNGGASADGLQLGIVADCESTGLDRETDTIIELAIVPFWYDPAAGEIVSVDIDRSYTAFENPAKPLDPEIVELTGLTDADLAGQSLDTAQINRLTEGASLVVAHSAQFDRPLVERRLPIFKDLPWSCSRNEVSWQKMFPETTGTSVAGVLAGSRREYSQQHRALADCLAVLRALTAPGAFAALLESSQAGVTRLWANGAAFGVKEQLRARRYRWNDKKKTWYKDISPSDLAKEGQELAKYCGTRWTWETIPATMRYKLEG